MSTKTKPSHKVYAVTKSGERSHWSEIGAAWARQDGDGFNLKLELPPLNGAEIVLRKPKAAEHGVRHERALLHHARPCPRLPNGLLAAL